MIRNELEYCVLGVVWRRGPCSAYAVRSEFEKSLSAHWSASTGSIYPVVARLRELGFVTATAEAQGRRRSSRLTITPRGEQALQEWMLRLDRGATAATYDPVRTRLLFLDALPSEARTSMIAAACAATRERLRELKLHAASVAEAGDRMEALATRGAEYELQARLDWLAEVADAVSA
jgi:DNA-binding PadR family transcriptional regulator